MLCIVLSIVVSNFFEHLVDATFAQCFLSPTLAGHDDGQRSSLRIDTFHTAQIWACIHLSSQRLSEILHW
jgi:hypothetical protein